MQTMRVKFFKRAGVSTHSPSRRRRAFTLAEMVISVGILGFVGAATSYLMLTSALTAKELYGTTDSRSERMIALNEIRYRLCDGQIGSVNKALATSGINPAAWGWRLMTFTDPTLPGSPTSIFFFRADTRELLYKADWFAAGDFKSLAKGPIEVTFKPGTDAGIGAEALVTVFVRTSSDLRYGQVDVRDGETVIYLRNPAAP